MKVGMLWKRDDPKQTLQATIEAAARRFKEKYGTASDECFVNKLTLPAECVIKTSLGPVSMKQSNLIAPEIFWIGDSRAE